MLTPETTTNLKIIQTHRDLFLKLRQFETIKPILSESRPKFYGTMAFCLEKNIPLIQLIELYRRGVEAGDDYFDLAVFTHEICLTDRRERYAHTVHDEGDALNPGKNQLQAGINLTENSLQRLKTQHQTGHKIALFRLAYPALAQIPDSVLAIEQSGHTYPQAWEILEQEQPETSPDHVIPGPDQESGSPSAAEAPSAEASAQVIDFQRATTAQDIKKLREE